MAEILLMLLFCLLAALIFVTRDKADIENQLAQKTAEVETLQSQVASLDTRLTAYIQRVVLLEREAAALENQTASLPPEAAQIKTLRSEVAGLQSEVQAYAQQVERLEREAASSAAQVESLTRESVETETLQSQVASLQSEVQAYAQQVKRLEREAAALENQTASLTPEAAQIKTLRSEVTSLQSDVQAYAQQVERLEREAASSAAQVESLVSEAASYHEADPQLLAALANMKMVDPVAYEQIFYVATETQDAKTGSIVVPRDQWEKLTTIEQAYSNVVVANFIQEFNESQWNDLEEAIAIISDGGWEGRAQEHDWPPIVHLRETDDYRFQRGSALLDENFKTKLETVVLALVKDIVNEYGTNVIEVVGHTDEEPVGRTRSSNLDQAAISALQTDDNAPVLTAADNAGLGLARAIAVTRALRSLLADDPQFKDVTVLPYSGGQIINLDETISEGVTGPVLADPNRRRIEIRLRRTDQPEGANLQDIAGSSANR